MTRDDKLKAVRAIVETLYPSLSASNRGRLTRWAASAKTEIIGASPPDFIRAPGVF